MTSVKVKFRPSSAKGREGVVYYQVTHERRVRQLASGYRVADGEWDGRSPGGRGPAATAVREGIGRDVERLARIAGRFDAEGLAYTSDDVIAEFRRYARECSLFGYMESLILALRKNGKVRTSETYRAALSSFREFRNGEDIPADCISAEVMEAYEAWHRSRGNSPNTVSFYTRILRAVYNRAVEDGLTDDRSPFRHVYTGVGKTVKRALPLSAVSRLKELDLSGAPRLGYARDMFMMSFFLRGMSFIDMAFLKKSDLRDGRVTYRRRKTGRQLTIGWTEEMQRILDRHPANPTRYLLPIITEEGPGERRAYRGANCSINRSLKKVAALAGMSLPLTMYAARHSWASAAKAKGVPLNIISEGMGHDSEAATQVYLASLDACVLDKANAMIISSL